jgi:acyl-CoA reductase-like NAD-dependent aldehyde dehydrogenase
MGDVDHAVAVARTAFEDGRWSGLPAADRAAIPSESCSGHSRAL